MSKFRKNGMLLAWSAAIGIWACVDTLRSAEADVTTVTITDKVLVKDCTPFGTNLNGRNLLKRHVEVNFEGSSHRVCLNGELFRDGFLCYTFGAAANKASQLDKHWPGGTILNFGQHSCRATHLWGGVLNTRHDNRRYRPTWLGVTLANQVIDGDLVETVHSAKPKFVASGKPGRRWASEGKTGVPRTLQLCVQKGPTRGIVFVNLDLTGPQDVVLAFDGTAVASAQHWLLSGDILTANNELEVDRPQATLTHTQIERFKTGHRLTLPPHSMTAVQWHTD